MTNDDPIVHYKITKTLDLRLYNTYVVGRLNINSLPNNNE